MTMRKRLRGQSTIEFALLLPLMIMLLFFVVNATLLYDTWVKCDAAAIEGARYVALHDTSGGEASDTAVQNHAADSVGMNDGSLHVAVSRGSWQNSGSYQMSVLQDDVTGGRRWATTTAHNRDRTYTVTATCDYHILGADFLGDWSVVHLSRTHTGVTSQEGVNDDLL